VDLNFTNRSAISIVILCFAALVCIESAFPQSRAGCNRDVLKEQANRFLSALEARKPSSLPLTPDAKFTENGREIAVGEGLWKTAGKILMKRTVVDTEKCATHTQAVIEENGRPIIYGVRLKMAAGALIARYDRNVPASISEIESFAARENDFLFNAKGLLETKNHDWEGVIPPQERSSRLGMIALADDYFEMFRKRPSVQVPFAADCNRWENGTLTTGRKADGSLLSSEPGRQCSPAGLQTLNHGARRFLLDREAGVVVAYLLFSSAYPDFHMFKIRNGKVELMQAVIGSGAPGTGWPDEPINIP
jgi:hypothetical protein